MPFSQTALGIYLTSLELYKPSNTKILVLLFLNLLIVSRLNESSILFGNLLNPSLPI